MITLDDLVARTPGLEKSDLERWIHSHWVRPDHRTDQYIFRDIDVARIHLIQDLRDVMQVNEEGIPIVLSLLDQLYDLRRRVHTLSALPSETASDVMRQALTAMLRSSA